MQFRLYIRNEVWIFFVSRQWAFKGALSGICDVTRKAPIRGKPCLTFPPRSSEGNFRQGGEMFHTMSECWMTSNYEKENCDMCWLMGNIVYGSMGLYERRMKRLWSQIKYIFIDIEYLTFNIRPTQCQLLWCSTLFQVWRAQHWSDLSPLLGSKSALHPIRPGRRVCYLKIQASKTAFPNIWMKTRGQIFPERKKSWSKPGYRTESRFGEKKTAKKTFCMSAIWGSLRKIYSHLIFRWAMIPHTWVPVIFRKWDPFELSANFSETLVQPPTIQISYTKGSYSGHLKSFLQTWEWNPA